MGIKKLQKNQIIYIAGNHEYYRTCMPEMRADLKKQATDNNIHLLDNNSVVLGGVRFLGTTLWTDFSLYSDDEGYDFNETIERSMKVMPDFHIIETEPGVKLTPFSSQELHTKAYHWLKNELDNEFSGPTVVISHHAPLPECIPPQYRGDPVSPAFASNLQHLMGTMDVWIHGHVHEPTDIECNGTRVISNPSGYPDEFDPPHFQPNFFIEL
ncbi:metallophosphoesterase [Halomonas sp. 11-S5]|uniref:metallophosphoesterase n=1 Tax=Halomonas sp. 11-S5 TaxID=2994064 RepID=UPI002469B5C4|nr:metallophosphoesterase [Halomonas sp. 11-S5]